MTMATIPPHVCARIAEDVNKQHGTNLSEDDVEFIIDVMARETWSMPDDQIARWQSFTFKQRCKVWLEARTYGFEARP